jgi:hypothetical protein
MKGRTLLFLGAVAALSGMLVPSAPAKDGPGGIDYDILDAGAELRAWGATAERLSGAPPADAFSGPGSGGGTLQYVVGDSALWLALDNYYGYYYFKWYTLRAAGENAEIWVSVDNQFPSGDTRNPVINTQEQIDYLLQEVEETIYPTDTEFFGTPDVHDGSNSLLVAWGYVPPGY